jgi:hypothetical protein
VAQVSNTEDKDFFIGEQDYPARHFFEEEGMSLWRSHKWRW